MSNATETKTFIININGVQTEYVLWKTDAPKAYDGFGTFTVRDYGKDGRFVLVPVNHKDWQMARYRSGLQKVEEEELNESIAHWLVELFFKRIQGGTD